MDLSDARDEVLIKYLLNELSKAENEEIEDKMVLDPELADRAGIVEMKLIDSYVLNEITAAEKARFEKGFLLFEENRDKVEDARAFHEARRSRDANVDVQLPAEIQSSWFASLSGVQISALAAVLVLVTTLVAILVVFRFAQNKLVASNNDANQNSGPQVAFQPENNNSNKPNEPGEIAKLNPNPNRTAVKSIVELRSRADVNSRGSDNGPVKPHLIRIPENTELLTLKVSLMPDQYYKESLDCSVDISSAKFEHLFPRNDYLKVKAQPTGGEFPYQVTITIPTAYLKERNLYYFRIVETDSLTPFKVKFIK